MTIIFSFFHNKKKVVPAEAGTTCMFNSRKVIIRQLGTMASYFDLPWLATASISFLISSGSPRK